MSSTTNVTNLQSTDERITWECGACGEAGAIWAECDEDGKAEEFRSKGCEHVELFMQVGDGRMTVPAGTSVVVGAT